MHHPENNPQTLHEPINRDAQHAVRRRAVRRLQNGFFALFTRLSFCGSGEGQVATDVGG